MSDIPYFIARLSLTLADGPHITRTFRIGLTEKISPDNWKTLEHKVMRALEEIRYDIEHTGVRDE